MSQDMDGDFPKLVIGLLAGDDGNEFARRINLMQPFLDEFHEVGREPYFLLNRLKLRVQPIHNGSDSRKGLPGSQWGVHLIDGR